MITVWYSILTTDELKRICLNLRTLLSIFPLLLTCVTNICLSCFIFILISGWHCKKEIKIQKNLFLLYLISFFIVRSLGKWKQFLSRKYQPYKFMKSRRFGIIFNEIASIKQQSKCNFNGLHYGLQQWTGN